MSLESEFSEYASLVESLEELGDEMIGPVEIQSGIRAVNGMADLLKKASKLSKDANNLEIREIILSLQEQILDTKGLLIETKGRVIELEEENQELKQKLEAKDNPIELVQGKHDLWYVEESNTPVCKTCRGDDGSPIELSETSYPPTMTFRKKYECPKCGYKKTIR